MSWDDYGRKGCGKGHMNDEDYDDAYDDTYGDQEREQSGMYREASTTDYTYSAQNAEKTAKVAVTQVKARGKPPAPPQPEDGAAAGVPSAATHPAPAHPPTKSKAEQLEDAREALEGLGLLVSGMNDASVLALYESYKENADARRACITAAHGTMLKFTGTAPSIEDMHRTGLLLRLPSRVTLRILLPPGFPSEWPSIECPDHTLKRFVEHACEQSAVDDPATLLSYFVSFGYSIPAEFFSASRQVGWEILRGVWRGVANETLSLENEGSGITILELEDDGTARSTAFDKAFMDHLITTGGRPSRAAGVPRVPRAAAPPRRAPAAPAAAAVPVRTFDAELIDQLTECRSNGATGFTFAYKPLLGGVPSSLSTIMTLNRLDLSGAKIASLPALPRSLTHVYMRRNRFAEIPECVMRLSNLAVVDFSFNAIECIPREFGALTALRSVNFEYNKLQFIDADFSGMTKLETLELTDNELRAVPSEIGAIASLWRLKLSANPIMQIPAEVYFQGTAAVKKYLVEMSPHNLPVPPSTLLQDIAKLRSADSRERLDCVIHTTSDQTQTLCHAFLIQARAPKLLELAAKSPRQADGTQTVEIYISEPGITQVHVQSFLAVVYGEQPSVNLSLTAATDLVATFGGANLVGDLSKMQNGHFSSFRGTESLVADFSKLLALTMSATTAAETPLFGDVITVCSAGGEDGAETAGEGAAGAHEATNIVIPKALACARCECIATMFHAGMSEAHRGVVTLSQSEPGVLSAFATYLLTDSHGKKMTPENVVALLFLASEYQVTRLRAMAECMVGFNVDVDNVAQVIQIAYFIDSERLKTACFFYAAANFNAVRTSPGYAELQAEVKTELAAKAAAIRANAGTA